MAITHLLIKRTARVSRPHSSARSTFSSHITCRSGVVAMVLACLLSALAPGLLAAQTIINTVAGGGPNNVPALAANIGQPVGVAVDSEGNCYIADGVSRVFRVDTSGQLTVVAGDGSRGFSGDGGPATSASLSQPYGVAVDGSVNLYIADRSNSRIRRVDATTGIITTVAGNGSYGFNGDGGPATAASLFAPAGVALDGSGNLYIADTGNHRIRRVDATTGTITTVAGDGSSGFSGDGGPATSASLSQFYGVALDGSGNVYIADVANDRIRQVDVVTGTITTVAGDGSRGFSGDGGRATAASLNAPTGVTVDSSGNLYIADSRNYRVRRVDVAAGIITTVAGNGIYGFSGDGGPATAASLSFPWGVALDGSGNLHIADTNNNRIRRVDASGIITTVAGDGIYGFSGDGGPATAASLRSPTGVALDGSGNLYIADTNNNRIRRVDASGIITTVAGDGIYGFSGDGGPGRQRQPVHRRLRQQPHPQGDHSRLLAESHSSRHALRRRIWFFSRCG
jgi:sugar lactone lactonase YvrE